MSTASQFSAGALQTWRRLTPTTLSPRRASSSDRKVPSCPSAPMISEVRTSDGVDFRQPEHQFAAAFEKGRLALDHVGLEMPRHDHQKIRVAGVAFGFGNDGDFGAGRVTAKLVGIHFQDGRQQFRRDVAKLQDDVALGRSSIAEGELAVALDFRQPRRKLFAVRVHTASEFLENFESLQAKLVLLVDRK